MVKINSYLALLWVILSIGHCFFLVPIEQLFKCITHFAVLSFDYWLVTTFKDSYIISQYLILQYMAQVIMF